MTATTAPNPTGIALHTLRKHVGLTLADVSKIAGVSPAYLSRVENGIESPSPAWITNLVESIGRHIDSAA